MGPHWVSRGTNIIVTSTRNKTCSCPTVKKLKHHGITVDMRCGENCCFSTRPLDWDCERNRILPIVGLVAFTMQPNQQLSHLISFAGLVSQGQLKISRKKKKTYQQHELSRLGNLVIIWILMDLALTAHTPLKSSLIWCAVGFVDATVHGSCVICKIERKVIRKTLTKVTGAELEYWVEEVKFKKKEFRGRVKS